MVGQRHRRDPLLQEGFCRLLRSPLGPSGWGWDMSAFPRYPCLWCAVVNRPPDAPVLTRGTEKQEGTWTDAKCNVITLRI